MAKKNPGYAMKSPRGRPQDRKSTRLNSSHRCISYAVFCLKKKNQKNHNVASGPIRKQHLHIFVTLNALDVSFALAITALSFYFELRICISAVFAFLFGDSR